MTPGWQPNPTVGALTAQPSFELEHATRQVRAQITILPDGSAVVSLSLSMAREDRARALAERLVAELADLALVEP